MTKKYPKENSALTFVECCSLMIESIVKNHPEKAEKLWCLLIQFKESLDKE